MDDWGSGFGEKESVWGFIVSTIQKELGESVFMRDANEDAGSHDRAKCHFS